MNAHCVLVCTPGRLDYELSRSWQQSLRERRRRPDSSDLLLLLEHPPCYTLGRSTRPEHLIGDHLIGDHPMGGGGPMVTDPTGSTADDPGAGIPSYPIERGGSVTYHGPGQLVGYPIMDLRQRGRDVHRFIRELEEVLIRSLAEFEIGARRRPGLTGVWVDDHKIAAIGVHVRHWITMHGFSLNVAPKLSHYRAIRPCGLDSEAVTSMAELGGEIPSLDAAGEVVTRQFAAVFERETEPVAAAALGLTA